MNEKQLEVDFKDDLKAAYQFNKFISLT